MAKWEIIEDNKFKKQTGGKAATRTISDNRAASNSKPVVIQKPNITPYYIAEQDATYKNQPIIDKLKAQGIKLNTQPKVNIVNIQKKLNDLKKEQDSMSSLNGGLGPSNFFDMLKQRDRAQEMGNLESKYQNQLPYKPLLNKANAVGTTMLTVGKYFAPPQVRQGIDYSLNAQDVVELYNNPTDTLNQASVASDALSFIKSKKTGLAPFNYAGDLITLKQKYDLFNNSSKQTYKHGGVIEDPMGQWAHPGSVTRIPSNQITMQGVNYPVLGVSDRGHTQMMYPGEDYSFRGKSVTEYPIMQVGGRYIPESVQPQPSKNYTGTFLPINRDPYGNARKKLYDNPNGDPSTESVIGINDDSGYYNIPTVVNGVRLSDDDAVNNFYDNGMYHTGYFNTQEEADRSADYRERANIGLSSTGLYKYGGEINFTYAGENHRVYKKESPTGNGKGIEGHIMVNHPTENKGKWDTIDLTKITNGKVKTVAQGVASTKKWHKENPEYANGGKVSNWEILEDLPKAQNGRFTNPPIYVNDPKDPRIGMYNDSLNLHKAYLFQKNHSERSDSDYDAIFDAAFKGTKNKNGNNYYEEIQKSKKLNFNSFADYKKASEDFNKFTTNPDWYDLLKTEPYKSKYAWTNGAAGFKNTEDFKKLGIKGDYDKIKYYESLNFSHPEDVAIGRYSSADISYKRIKPTGSYWGGKGFNPIYAAPKQPYIVGSIPSPSDPPPAGSMGFFRSISGLPPTTTSTHSPDTVSYLTPSFKTIPNAVQKQQEEITSFNKMGLENLDPLQSMQRVPEPNPITSVPKDYVTITTGSSYRNPETGAFEQKTFKIDKVTGKKLTEPVFKTNNIKIVPGGYRNGGKTKKSNWQIIEY